MTRNADFCRECGVSFGVVERSDSPATCFACFLKLNPSIFECEQCGAVIEVGESFHLAWACLCAACAKRSRISHGLSAALKSTGFSDRYLQESNPVLTSFWSAML